MSPSYRACPVFAGQEQDLTDRFYQAGKAYGADALLRVTAGLYAIAWQARNAEFRIFLGDRSAWNGGLGTEAAALLVQYAFDRLNLNKV